MKRRTIMKMILSVCLFVATVATSSITANAAIKELTVDEEEYNLLIEDYPSFSSEWYSTFAKMNNKKDSSDYELSLFDDWSSTELMVEAFEKDGTSVNLDNIFGLDIMLYKLDKDGEYYPTDGGVDLTVICPIPDFWVDTPEKVDFYQLTSAGKPKKFAFTLVSVNEIPCFKLTIKTTGTYAFLLTSSNVESTEEPDPTPIPTPIPTTKPTKTPTVAPTKTPAATPNVQTNTNINGQTMTRPLDATPQTGDSTPMELHYVVIALSGLGLCGLLYFVRRH